MIIFINYWKSLPETFEDTHVVEFDKKGLQEMIKNFPTD